MLKKGRMIEIVVENELEQLFLTQYGLDNTKTPMIRNH